MKLVITEVERRVDRLEWLEINVHMQIFSFCEHWRLSEKPRRPSFTAPDLLLLAFVSDDRSAVHDESIRRHCNGTFENAHLIRI